MRINRNPNINRRRIGLILPSVNAVLEPELYHVAPPGFSFHSTRVLLRETTPEGLREMNREVEQAARLIRTVGPDVVVYACTSGTFLEGWEGLRRLTATLTELVGCPVVTTSGAMVEALEYLSVRRVALATPYLGPVNQLEIAFLTARGFDVTSCRGLGLSGTAIREVPPERVIELVLETVTPEADAVFVSCTDLRALEVLQALEDALQKPVLSSNQVTLWGLLRASGWSQPIVGYGRLLAELGTARQ